MVISDGPPTADEFVEECQRSITFLVQAEYTQRNKQAAADLVDHAWWLMSYMGTAETLPARPGAWAELVALPPKQAIQAAIQSLSIAIGWGKDQRKPEAGTSEEALSQRVNAVLDDTDIGMLAIAGDPRRTVEQKMQDCLALDSQAGGYTSERWAKLLKVSAPAVRKTEFWKEMQRRKRV